jgi:fructoselysine 6-kinase
MGIVAVGDNVVDCYLDSGHLYPGGNCVNVSVAVRRAGLASAYVGAIGTDMAGDVVHTALMDEGIELTRVRRVDGPNAYATVRHLDQDRHFGPRETGVRVFTPDADDYAFIGAFSLAHSSYCSFLEDSLGEIAGHTRLSYDFDNGHETGYADDLLQFAWIAEFSAPGLSDADVHDVARWAHDKGPVYVLVTRGAHGAVLYDGNEFIHQEAAAGDIVDTLGAGDAFIGRLLTGLVTGEPVPALLGAAAAAASTTCGTFGGFGHGVPIPDGYPPGMTARSIEVPAPTTL